VTECFNNTAITGSKCSMSMAN